jgi:peptidoglycan/LPS O-acetylase OafA/YrhL
LAAFFPMPTDYFRTFYVPRFFCIVPLYLVWLAVSCLAMRFTVGGAVGNWMHRETFSMWPYLLYLQNFWMAAKDTLTSFSAGGTWSLAIEEQFYLTLPFIIRYAPCKWLPRIIVAGIAGAPVLRTLIFFSMPNHRTALFVMMPARADSLLLGVTGAMLLRNENGRTWIKSRGFLLRVALLVFAVGTIYLTLIHPECLAW